MTVIVKGIACATSLHADLHMGCASVFWEDNTGEHHSIMVLNTRRPTVPVRIVCYRCGRFCDESQLLSELLLIFLVQIKYINRPKCWGVCIACSLPLTEELLEKVDWTTLNTEEEDGYES